MVHNQGAFLDFNSVASIPQLDNISNGRLSFEYYTISRESENLFVVWLGDEKQKYIVFIFFSSLLLSFFLLT